ncbi:hypothetical protein S83_070426, partial [Arachis hypogaea]
KNNSSKTKTVIIIIACVLVPVVLLISGVYLLWRKNQINNDVLLPEDTPISIQYNSQEGQRHETLNADFPTVPLIWIRQSTNNFLNSCKLGEG